MQLVLALCRCFCGRLPFFFFFFFLFYLGISTPSPHAILPPLRLDIWLLLALILFIRLGPPRSPTFLETWTAAHPNDLLGGVGAQPKLHKGVKCIRSREWRGPVLNLRLF